MRGWLTTFRRLFAVQGAWNYERMLGQGIGYATAPLLEELAARDPARYREALARSAEYFNCNPNLAGLVVGATVHAELHAVPGDTVRRLKQALTGPLGALGDQFFWAGLVPLLVALGLAGVALGGGPWPALGLVGCYAVVRIAVARWSLRTGLATGLRVGAALTGSWLPRSLPWIGPLAGLAAGLALPLVARWFLPAGAGADAAWLVGPALAGGVLLYRQPARVTPLRLALGTTALVCATYWFTTGGIR